MNRCRREALFQRVDGRKALFEVRDGVGVQVHPDSMSKLVRYQLGVDSGLARQACMRTSHHLEACPVEFDFLELGLNVPPPEVVTTDCSCGVFGSEYPSVG